MGTYLVVRSDLEGLFRGRPEVTGRPSGAPGNTTAERPQQVPRQRQIAEHSPRHLNRPPVYPLLIAVDDGGKRSVVAVGNYAPPWEERVDVRQLGPAARIGLKRLGFDQPNVFNEPF
jgi:hypothetical protein